MQKPRKTKQTTSVLTPAAAAAALQRIEPRLASLRGDELAPTPDDVAAAVSASLVSLANIAKYREAIAADLPAFLLANIDDLESLALATWYADLVHSYAGRGEETTKALVEEANKLREGLMIAAEALAHRELLDRDQVASIRKAKEKNEGEPSSDLAALAALFEANWTNVASRTAVEKSEVERATSLGSELLIAKAAKARKGDATDESGANAAADTRARALTLFARSYDQCRRALSYVRWAEGDVDTLAPPLFKKKRASKKEKGGDASEDAEAEAPSTDAAP